MTVDVLPAQISQMNKKQLSTICHYRSAPNVTGESDHRMLKVDPFHESSTEIKQLTPYMKVLVQLTGAIVSLCRNGVVELALMAYLLAKMEYSSRATRNSESDLQVARAQRPKADKSESIVLAARV
jgi:hypothetical protein